MEKLGLVLAGGGGKGAYEIGVWQALRDLGLEPSVAAVSGTSVGALNAALFATGDLERARTVWRDLSPAHILFSPDPEKAARQISEFSRKSMFSATPVFASAAIYNALKVPVSLSAFSSLAGRSLSALLFLLRAQLIPSLSHLLMSGIISADGLGEMIDSAVDCARLAASPVRCYATCLRIPRLKPDRFLLNGRAPEDIPVYPAGLGRHPLLLSHGRGGEQAVSGRRPAALGRQCAGAARLRAGGLPDHPGGPPVRQLQGGCRAVPGSQTGGGLPQCGAGRPGGYL